MISLFGEEIPDVARKPTAPKKGGHFAAPGTGPKGETCGTCQHAVRIQLSSKSVHKCELARRCWTHGPGGWRKEEECPSTPR